MRHLPNTAKADISKLNILLKRQGIISLQGEFNNYSLLFRLFANQRVPTWKGVLTFSIEIPIFFN